MPIVIRTQRLLLRPMVADDAEGLLTVFGDPKVMASFHTSSFGRERMVAWVERNLAHQRKFGYGLFSVILKSEGRLIGDCGLEHVDIEGEPCVALGYDLASDYWGRGLATEAACAVRDFAFTTLELQGLVSLIRADNCASQRVAEKVGMERLHTFMERGIEYTLYGMGNSSAE
jgi:ribosomal-protein-alanine N-acetyltransferase